MRSGCQIVPPVVELLVGDLEALAMLTDRLEREHRTVGVATNGFILNLSNRS